MVQTSEPWFTWLKDWHELKFHHENPLILLVTVQKFVWTLIYLIKGLTWTKICIMEIGGILLIKVQTSEPWFTWLRDWLDNSPVHGNPLILRIMVQKLKSRFRQQFLVRTLLNSNSSRQNLVVANFMLLLPVINCLSRWTYPLYKAFNQPYYDSQKNHPLILSAALVKYSNSFLFQMTSGITISISNALCKSLWNPS